MSKEKWMMMIHSFVRRPPKNHSMSHVVSKKLIKEKKIPSRKHTTSNNAGAHDKKLRMTSDTPTPSQISFGLLVLSTYPFIGLGK